METEANGLMTYDRALTKLDMAELLAINQQAELAPQKEDNAR